MILNSLKQSARLALTVFLSLAPGSASSVFGQAFGQPRPTPAPQYQVITGNENFPAPDSMLFYHMDRIAQAMFHTRHQRVAQIQSDEQWREHLSYTRKKFLEMLGEFPNQRPRIKAKFIARVERPDYFIEKVVFNVLPAYPITALVYVPRRHEPPFPAFLCPVGHSPEGKSISQGRRLSLARKGYLVMAIDPIGLGERKPLVDPVTNTSLVEMREHSYLGHQTLLAGTNLQMYFLWEGMRAIDYLFTREDVDTSRIACAGISGGGNVTAWLSALDERIEVAMPVCHVTSNERRWESLGMADAEQNLFPCIAAGVEYGDILQLIAPRPLLIACSSRDFFPIAGAYEAFHDAMRYYRHLKSAHCLRISEVPGGHAWPLEQRQNTYAWVNLWLGKSEEGVAEEPFTPDEYHDLLATETGLQHTAYGEKDIFELNREYARSVKTDIQVPSGHEESQSTARTLREQLSELTGFQCVSGQVPWKKLGTLEREGLMIEKLVYFSEPDVYIPALLFRPARSSGKLPGLVYCHPEGKAAGAHKGKVVPELAKRGVAVLCIDPRGTGETRTFHQYRDTEEGYHALLWGSETNMSYDALMIGKSLIGMRALDVIRAVDYLVSREDIDSTRIGCFGQEEMAFYTLAAACFDNRLNPVILSRLPLSYMSMVENRVQNWHANVILPGVLKKMDLKHMAALIAPRRLTLLNSVDQMRRRVPAQQAEQEYSWTMAAYRASGRADSFSIGGYDSPEQKLEKIYSRMEASSGN